MKGKIDEELREGATENRVPCKALRAMAEKLGVSYEDAGKAADALGIKITDCELGCF